MAMTEEEYLNHLIQHATKPYKGLHGHTITVNELIGIYWLEVRPDGTVMDLSRNMKPESEELANATRAYVAMHKLSG